MVDVYQDALATIKLASKMSIEYYGKPMTLCYSGGKDSDTILKLAIESGEPFIVSHNHTTADAPETVLYIRRKFKKLDEAGIKTQVIYPIFKSKPVTMWSLIPQKLMPPTRLVRYCCSVLKETPITDSVALLGVRSSESSQRSTRSNFEIIGKTKKKAQGWNVEAAQDAFNDSHVYPEIFDCNLIAAMKQRKCAVSNPVIAWSEKDVFDYLQDDQINPLYSEGFKRVGCIGCPMAGRTRSTEFARYPAFKRAYTRAFDKMLIERSKRGKDVSWQNGEEVMHWWIQDGVIPGQLQMNLNYEME
jgi:phosphoadenosine phosphosulfate reductase